MTLGSTRGCALSASPTFCKASSDFGLHTGNDQLYWLWVTTLLPQIGLLAQQRQCSLAMSFYIVVVALSASPTFYKASSDFGLHTGNDQLYWSWETTSFPLSGDEQWHLPE